MDEKGVALKVGEKAASHLTPLHAPVKGSDLLSILAGRWLIVQNSFMTQSTDNGYPTSALFLAFDCFLSSFKLPSFLHDHFSNQGERGEKDVCLTPLQGCLQWVVIFELSSQNFCGYYLYTYLCFETDPLDHNWTPDQLSNYKEGKIIQNINF